LGLSGKDTSQTSVAAAGDAICFALCVGVFQPLAAGEYVASPGGTPPYAPSAIAAGVTGSQPDPAYNGPDVDKEHPWKYDLAGPAVVLLPAVKVRIPGSGQFHGHPRLHHHHLIRLRHCR